MLPRLRRATINTTEAAVATSMAGTSPNHRSAVRNAIVGKSDAAIVPGFEPACDETRASARCSIAPRSTMSEQTGVVGWVFRRPE